MRIQITDPAKNDFREIWLFYAEESGSRDVANRVLNDIMKSLLVLKRFPLSGRVRGTDAEGPIRSFVSGKYLVFYRVLEDTVFVTRVLHASRDIDGILLNV